MTWTIPQNVVSFGPEYEEAVVTCLRRGWITEGAEAERFVGMLRITTGARYVALAPNGTLALYLALRSAGVGPGDTVVVPDLTFIASATAVLMTGANPIFADVNDLGLMTDETMLRAIGRRDHVKAVMPAHLFGFLAELSASWPQRAEYVVEDACQALGVLLPARFADSSRRIQALSFYADKALTTGEGGAVATNDDVTAERAKFIRNQGRAERGSFLHPEVGINLRMTDLQCAIGATQLVSFGSVRANRQRVWNDYREALRSCEFVRLLTPPAEQEPGFVPFRVVVAFDKEVAAEVAAVMRRRGVVEPREMFVPLHLQPCFARMRGCTDDEQFPGAIRLWRTSLLLPCWPAMTEDAVGTVVAEVTAAYREATRA